MSTSTDKRADKKSKKSNKKVDKVDAPKLTVDGVQPRVKKTTDREKSKVASTTKPTGKKTIKPTEEDTNTAADQEESSSKLTVQKTKGSKDGIKGGKLLLNEPKKPQTNEKDTLPTHISAVKRKRGGDEVGQDDGGILPSKRKRGKVAVDDSENKQVKKKKIAASPVLEEDSSESEQSDQEEDEHLHGFSTDEDSSDDEGMDADPLDVKKLPKAVPDNAAVRDRLEKAKKKKQEEDRGVLYIGRIPHGFYEDQMKEYFSQFGNVTRIRLARNKKTGKSKHYGFVEFDSAAVAQIVSETMDNYLLAGHLLQCKVIPKSKVHPELWIGANRKWKRIPHGRMERLAHNKPRTDEQKAKAEKRLLGRQSRREKKIKEAGIDYSLGKVGYTPVTV
ncbi:hypothetical protein FRC17_006764 [Serendipita sp. 399]|nr:hypothetical protein FRC17_006764 [Serendipita sp. 399]